MLAYHTDMRCPDEGLLAWEVFHRLAAPSVERFRLHSVAWASLNLKLPPRRLRQLLRDLDEIIAGRESAREILFPPPKPKGKI